MKNLILLFSIVLLASASATAQSLPQGIDTLIPVEGSISLEYIGRENVQVEHLIFSQADFSTRIFKIPVGLGFQYTNDTLWESPIRYQIHYDIQQTLSVLKEDIKRKALEEYPYNLSETDLKKNVEKMGAYESFLNDSSMLGSLAEYELQKRKDSVARILRSERDSLTNQLNAQKEQYEVGISKRVKEIDSLTSALDYNPGELKKLELANREYNRLQKEYDILRTKYDSIRFVLDIDQWSEDQVLEKANSLGLTPGWLEKMKFVRQLTIGESTPMFSRTTLGGTPINGGNIQIGNEKVIFELASGNTVLPQSPYFQLDQYEANILAARAGYKTAESELCLNFVYGKGNGSAISFKENYVTGISGEINPLPGVLRIRGEASLSLLLLASQSPGYSQAEIGMTDLRKTAQKIYGQKALDGILDKAASIDADLSLFEGKTIVNSNLEHIGGDFFTVGNFFLRPDINRWKIGLKQKVIKDQVSFFASASKGRDNLLAHKYAITETTRLEAGVSLRFENLPYLQASYIPFNQNNDLSTTHSSGINVMVGYDYPLSVTTTGSSILLFYKNIYDVATPDTGMNFNYDMASFSQSVAGKKFSLNTSVSYMKVSTDIENIIFYGNMSATVKASKKIYIATGVKFENNLAYNWRIGYHCELKINLNRLRFFSAVENNPFYDPEELVFTRGFVFRSGFLYTL